MLEIQNDTIQFWYENIVPIKKKIIATLMFFGGLP